MTFDISNLSIKPPTQEDLERFKLNRVERSRSDKNSFSFWYPSVERLEIRSPKTAIIDFPPLATYWLTGDKIDDVEQAEAESIVKDAVEKIRAFGREFGYPVFLKNSFTSAKHYWNDSCFISSESDDIAGKISELSHYLTFHTPLIALHLIAREFIKLDPAFYAFNGTPITEEYRVFADNGKVVGWQPYWPEAAIQDPNDENWKEKLRKISQPSGSDIVEMSKVSEVITKDLGGYWSVDFLKDKDGDFWLIDMALGDMSFKCETGFVEIP